MFRISVKLSELALRLSGPLLLVVIVSADPALGTSRFEDAAAQYHQRSWTREQGLPDNNVRALVQASNGYLWIGTRSGLARFDGLRFTVFDHVNTPALTSDDITALAKDRDGSLWIGTPKGLSRRDLDGGLTSYTQREGLCDQQVSGD